MFSSNYESHTDPQQITFYQGRISIGTCLKNYKGH
jgi:hypothetical protein